ncbi:hypothetical protein BRADI_4g15790v3 [Brachypodium distachyon]|uniref:Xylanase inhibitor C-terminal domain-containing protein n=1 Tax=Brachypodium distachyon TaxID=15368 RepID=I1IKY9_BRADI|nr:hypothetical protein BRADI_4g15790v3 [Brachypodium distachyon]
MVMIQAAYDILVRDLAQRVAALGLPRVHRSEFGFCFRVTGAAFAHLPTVALHTVEGDGIVLGPRKLFMQVSQDMCLAVVPSRHITIIGAMQQVDTRFVYDLAGSKLYFANENCEADTTPHD